MNGNIIMLTALARKRAIETCKPYGIIGPDGPAIITSGGDLIISTGAIPPQVAAARAKASATPSVSTGGNCGCGTSSGCPTHGTPEQRQAVGAVANMQGRQIAGRGGKCDYAPLSFLVEAGIGAVVTVAANSPVLICPEKLILIAHVAAGTPGAGFLITTLKFGNRPQFAELLAGSGLHSNLFSLDATQVIPFKGDCLDTGVPFNLTATSLDAAAQTLYGVLMGPMQGM